MSLRDLYQEQILDHNRNPRNYGSLEAPARRAEGFNPLCGDKVTITVRVNDGILEEIRFEGKGCAISTASASMMTQAVRGRQIMECEKLFRAFHEMVTGRECPVESERTLGALALFGGVREFPARVKCATLAWHTLQAALHENAAVVSTE